MLVFEELRLTAIGRFVDEQVVDFTKLGNLVQVDGIRLDTGGSSGSGKSTLFNGLEFILGINDLPSSVLQSRLTKDAISGTLKGTLDDVPFSITRGRGKLSVTLNGETTTGSKLAEEKIDQILGMSRKLFRPLLHKRQKEGGFFLQFTPKEIHEFLTDALGLGELRKKQELVDKKAKELEDKVTQARNLLGQSESGLKATQDAVLGLGTAPVKEVDQGTVVGLKQALDSAQAALMPVQLRQRLEMETLEVSKPTPRPVNVDQSTLTRLEHESQATSHKIDEIVAANALAAREERDRVKHILAGIQGKRVEIAQAGYSVQVAAQAKADAVRVAGEIKKIRECVCPTCAQSWATDSAKAHEAELMGKIAQLKETIAAGARAEANVTQLQSDIAQLEPLAVEKSIPMPAEYNVFRANLDTLKTQISTERQRIRLAEQTEHEAQRAILEVFNGQKHALLQKQQSELAQLAANADNARRAFEASAFKLKSYEEARVRHENSANNLQIQTKKYQNDIVSYQKSLEILESDQKMVDELRRAIKSYTSVAFDEALEYVGSVATDIIRSIPNMANATVQLEGVRETKDGKVKEEVNAVLSMDGETGVPIKSLSGGERSSVDLAVDLAVIDLLENKSNKGVNMFILDEPFTGLDTVSIEMAIEKLRSLNKRLVIVDHNPEVKQMVESKLVVQRDGLTSKILQN